MLKMSSFSCLFCSFFFSLKHRFLISCDVFVRKPYNFCSCVCSLALKVHWFTQKPCWTLFIFFFIKTLFASVPFFLSRWQKSSQTIHRRAEFKGQSLRAQGPRFWTQRAPRLWTQRAPRQGQRATTPGVGGDSDQAGQGRAGYAQDESQRYASLAKVSLYWKFVKMYYIKKITIVIQRNTVVVLAVLLLTTNLLSSEFFFGWFSANIASTVVILLQPQY